MSLFWKALLSVVVGAIRKAIVLWVAYRKGRADVLHELTAHEAENERKFAEIATADNPEAVRDRLRGGTF